jgi:hypothetical protein
MYYHFEEDEEIFWLIMNEYSIDDEERKCMKIIYIKHIDNSDKWNFRRYSWWRFKKMSYVEDIEGWYW